jgi:hypothetical protein
MFAIAIGIIACGVLLMLLALDHLDDGEGWD